MGFGSGFATGVGAGVGVGVGLAGGFGVDRGPLPPPLPPFEVAGVVSGLAACTGGGVPGVAGVAAGASDGTGEDDGVTEGLGDGSGGVGVACEPGSVDGCGPGTPGRDEDWGLPGELGFGVPAGPGLEPPGAVVGSTTAMPGVANGAPVIPMPSATDASTRLITPRASTSRRRCAAVTTNQGSSECLGPDTPRPRPRW